MLHTLTRSSPWLQRWVLQKIWLCCLIGMVGCVAVKPYERELLARADMEFVGNRHVTEAEAHSTDVREGSNGGFGVGGGGCGCN